MAKPIEAVKGTAMLATHTETHIEVFCVYANANGQDDSVVVRIPFAKFDPVRRKYNADTEAMARANKTLDKFFGTDVANAETDIVDKPCEIYLRDGRGYLYPVKPFVPFTSLTGEYTKALKKLATKGTVFETVPLTEWEGGHRFNFGIKAELDGEMHNIRISQFEVETPEGGLRRVGVKYETESSERFVNAMNNTQLSDDQRKRLEAAITAEFNKARQARIKELDESLGIDVESMLQNDDSFKVTVSVTLSPDNEHSYLIATKADED